MCSMCLHTPCMRGCPHEETPAPIHTCVQCHEGIYADDRYADLEKGPVCEICLDGMTKSELLESVGYPIKQARKGDSVEYCYPGI
jgi:hypothetical protein